MSRSGTPAEADKGAINATIDENQLITTCEIAKGLNVSIATIYDLEMVQFNPKVRL